ncbi:MAG TPA: magnesium chelatase [Desulfotomaculum sp.]|nr:magnesium chelatase [Desulfotomaculum sp.]
MLATVKSTALTGLDGHIIQVEVDVSNGLPCFDLVGLPDPAVKESRDRVRAAIKNSGFQYPLQRITVNLAPADIRKEGPLYDLPIAVGILAATAQIEPDALSRFILIGELSLNGSLRRVNGVLPNTLAARAGGFSEIILPSENAAEAALVHDIRVYPVENLEQLVRFLRGEEEIPAFQLDISQLSDNRETAAEDMADVRGQAVARRALEVSAAGGHNLLMLGSPGSGKTMLARRLPGILPDLSFEESLEVTKLYSLAGLIKPGQPLVRQRPFRAPHHSASSIGLVGGGRHPRPGEISLAHNGVLFLDELPEFPRDALESLRQPLEDGIITISRASSSATFPARLMLVGAMNPCPCGFFGDPAHACTCTPYQIQRYISRISGPLLDRIDIHLEVPRLPYLELADEKQNEPSCAIKERVIRAREIQKERFGNKSITCNAMMKPQQVRKFCGLSREAKLLLRGAFTQLNLSARAHDRILKVSRTIADLADSELIESIHLAEAIQYRSLERKYWFGAS